MTRTPLERDVQKPIRQALEKLGYFVARMQCGKVKVRGGWMQLAPDGTADLLAIKGKHTLWVECKKPEGGEHSDKQKDFAAMVKRAGHTYVLARSLDDVTAVLA